MVSFAQQRYAVLTHADSVCVRACVCTQESGATWDRALEEQLCYEIKTFLLAGHETSAAMLTWSVYELSQAADMQKKVRKAHAAPLGYLLLPALCP